MIQLFNMRLVVQSDSRTKEKYYPKVLTATTAYEYPFSVPTATIEIWTNTEESTDGYVSPVKIPDIVRLQVSTKYHVNEPTVWEDIFEGRIRDIESTYDTTNGNTTTLFCVGHISTQSTNLLYNDYTWTNAVDAATIIHDVVLGELNVYDTFIDATYNAAFTATGISISSYNAPANQKFVTDVFTDLEKLSNYSYYFSTRTIYDSNNNLSLCNIRWQPLPNKPTTKYAVIQGSQRFISADFKSSAEELFNMIRISGDTITTTSTTDTSTTETQYIGGAESSASIQQYGYHAKVTDVASLESNNACAQIAASLVVRFRNPIVSGQAVILGTPQAKLGDLVRVKIPSLEINGNWIDRNYHVYKVQHDIDATKFETTLDFTKVKKTPEDYIASLNQQSRINNMNSVNSADVSDPNQDGSAQTLATSDTSDNGDSGYTDTSTWSDNTDTSMTDSGD